MLIAADIKGKVSTIEKIKIAALECFSQAGFEGTSLRQIAQEAGLIHQKITYHFQTKENLFVDVLRDSFEDLRNFRLSLVFNPDEQDPIKQYTEHLKQVAHYFRERPQFVKIIYQEVLSNSPRITLIRPYIEAMKADTMRELVFLRQFGFGANITIDQLILIFSGSFHARFIHPYVNAGIRGQKQIRKKDIDDYIESLCKILTH